MNILINRNFNFMVLTAVLLISFTSNSAFADGAAAAGGANISSVATTISGFSAGIAAIGLAVLSLVVVAKGFKWAKSAL